MGNPVTRDDAWRGSALALGLAALLGGVPGCGSESAAGTTPVPRGQIAASRPSPAVHTYLPGHAYFGRNAYVEFRPGQLPIVISAPHGGSLEPAEIPNRTSGTIATDLATEDLARRVAAALRTRTGREPSLVVCRLKRSKLDVNRAIAEGAQRNPAAEQAWNEYHGFMDAARALAAGRHGRALVIDLHGHGHPRPRVEIGYLIGAADLDEVGGALALEHAEAAGVPLDALVANEMKDERGNGHPLVLAHATRLLGLQVVADSQGGIRGGGSLRQCWACASADQCSRGQGSNRAHCSWLL